ncbi:hypothetical protein [Nitrincola sp. A-D6]|nr:hypothetical protein [Nitrincola sp. A-D6]
MLKEFERGGLVQLSRGRICVRDIEALKQAAAV